MSLDGLLNSLYQFATRDVVITFVIIFAFVIVSIIWDRIDNVDRPRKEKKTAPKDSFKEKLKIAKPIIKQAGGELIGHDPDLVVMVKTDDAKTKLIDSLGVFGWRYTPKPEDKDTNILHFTHISS